LLNALPQKACEEKRIGPRWFSCSPPAHRFVSFTCRWPEAVLQLQRQWIGHSRGALIDFRLDQQLSDKLSSSAAVARAMATDAKRAAASTAAVSASASSSNDRVSGGSGSQQQQPSQAEQAALGLAEAGTVRVFTSRPDTLCGVTYVVLAPEHPLVQVSC
jgi:leucyl-tRNA synthetase